MASEKRIEEIRKWYGKISHEHFEKTGSELPDNFTDKALEFLEYLLAALDEAQEALETIKNAPSGWAESSIMPKYPCPQCVGMKEIAAEALKPKEK